MQKKPLMKNGELRPIYQGIFQKLTIGKIILKNLLDCLKKLN